MRQELVSRSGGDHLGDADRFIEVCGSGGVVVEDVECCASRFMFLFSFILEPIN